MKCRDLEELLSAYADGELSRTQREFIEEHLAGCADCRAKLAEFTSVGRKLSSLRQTPKPPDIKETTMSKIKASGASPDKLYRPWLRPAMAIGAAVIIIALLLAGQPWVIQSPEALAVSIVRNSPEVQAALNGEEIKEVEVTTSVVDEEGNLLMMLVRTEERAVATSVDLDTWRVTEVVRVSVPDFQPGDEQRSLDVARADLRVRDLLVQGGIIDGVRLGYSLDIYQFTGPEEVAQKEGEAVPIATVTINVKGKSWYATVDLNKGEVMGLAKPAAVMTLVHISEFVSTIAAPVLLVLAALLILGLAYNDRAAKASAGVASMVLGIIGLFIGLYAMSSIWWRLVIIIGVPAAGLIIGITDFRQRSAKRWLPVTGIALCALALAWVLFDAVMVPDGNAGMVTGVALVIAGIIVYALYEQIRKIPRKCWRPALMVGVAVAVLVLALVQPWSGSLEPQSVLAKTHEALENIQTYRLDYFGTTTVDGETSSHHMEVTFATPDRYHISVTNDGQRDEFIIIGNTQYVTNSASSRALIMASSGSFSSILTKEATLDVLDELGDLQTLPEETIDGVRCLHYLGKWDMEKRIEGTRHNIQEYNAESDTRVITDEQMEEMFEQMRSIDVTHEIWIGKEDYLIRQLKTEQRGPVDKEGILSVSMTMQYSGFNQPVTIEPPLDDEGNLLPGWRIYAFSPKEIFFNCQTRFEVTGEDPAHRQINAIITVTNTAMEATAGNVRVELRNSEVFKGNNETPWINAIPSSPEPVILKGGESETFNASWECDINHIADDELDELLERTVIKITYFTPEGEEAVRMYTAGGAVYPSAVPPASPPGK